MSDSTPTVRKQGGVAIPLTMSNATHYASPDSDTALVNDTQVAWKGPKPESTTEEPFGRGHSSKQLKAGATSFKPASDMLLPSKPAPISFLNKGSTPDNTPDVPTIVESSAELRSRDHAQNTSLVGPVGSGDRQRSPNADVVFTGDPGINDNLQYPGGHFVRIDNIKSAEFVEFKNILRTMYQWSRKVLEEKSKGYPHDKYTTLYVCFNDLRHADEAANDVSIVRPKWNLTHITQVEYAAAPQNSAVRLITEPFDGQVILSARWKGDLKNVDTDGLREEVIEAAEGYGQLYAFAEMSKPNSCAVEFRAEFFKITESKNALQINEVQPYHCTNIDWVIVTRKYMKIESPRLAPDTPHQRTINRAEIFQSPTSRSAWRFDDNGNTVPVPPGWSAPAAMPFIGAGDIHTPRSRYQSAPQPQIQGEWMDPAYQARSQSWAVSELPTTSDSEPQCVSIHRIESGQDVRTTIMLRNIPNRWSCHDLKKIIDVTSAGQYDFSYLRIDFKQTTNVGYAFVNFVDPISIVPFVQQYVGKDWNGGYSRRTAQVSYATIQGFDCLVEKFRNSSVLDEYEEFRPKLWWTKESAAEEEMIGTLRTFPVPNNISKKQRSSDNAGQIGLYPPHNNHRGGADRARRSNYDRGTPRQIQEDAVYSAQQSPVNNGWAQGGMGYYPGNPPVGTSHNQQLYYGQVAQYQPHMAMMTYAGQLPAGGGGYGAQYYPGPQTYNYGYPFVANPASQLRTLSHGRLANGPKKVTVGNTLGIYGHIQQPEVPRAFTEGPQSPGDTSNGAQASTDAGGQGQQSKIIYHY